jgi:hypothetical protein
VFFLRLPSLRLVAFLFCTGALRLVDEPSRGLVGSEWDDGCSAIASLLVSAQHASDGDGNLPFPGVRRLGTMRSSQLLVYVHGEPSGGSGTHVVQLTAPSS